MSEVRVRKGNRFGYVPDSILENRELSLEARAVAAWLCGRQDGFKIGVETMRRRFLNIGQKRWKAIRTELERVGWWRSTRTKTGPCGQFVWKHEFSADGFEQSETALAPNESEPAIIPFSRDGASMDAEATDAKGVDNHNVVYQQDVNHHPKPLPGGGCNDSAHTDQKGSRPCLEDLVNAAYWQGSGAGTVKNPSAWRASVRRRLNESGPTSEDLDTFKQWREASVRAAERETAVAKNAEAIRRAAEEVGSSRGRANGKSILDKWMTTLKPLGP